MAVFEYIAHDANGNKFTGTYRDVGNVSLLKEELGKMGDTLIKAKRKRNNVKKQVKIKQSEVITFIYKFAGMCSAGLPILRCLETLEEQTENPAFQRILMDVTESVETGSTLRDAFAKHRNIFSEFFLGMVSAGESGGKLSQTLEMSATYLERQADIRRKVMSAFTYPIVVGIMCVVIVSSLIIFVIPVFSKLYSQLHVQLPGPTQALVNISLIVKEQGWFILIGVAAVIFLFSKITKKAYFKAKWDVFKLNIPGLAKLNQMIIVSKFIRTFAMLISAGVTLNEALDIANQVANNSKICKITDILQRSIEAGNPVASSLKNHAIFPPMIVQLAASGEESGALSEMLNKGVDIIDKDVECTINNLLVKLEPAMTVIMGIVIGFMLMAVYLPMFDYMSNLK